MLRCPRCGVRVRDDLATCRVHGPVAQPEPHVTANDADEQAMRALTPGTLETVGYRLQRKLGEGGFGAVYAVQRLSDGRALALKVCIDVSPGAHAQLVREAALMERAGDVAPTVHAVGTLRGSTGARHAYIVMDRVDAETLAERLNTHAPMALAQFSVLALGLLDALQRLHARGVVHRDLKPENVFLGADGGVTLIDFGLARSSDEESGSASSGADVGTAEYMSPEQCLGAEGVDARSDIYALGVMFYEALTGAPPFWGKASDVREAHVSQRPRPLSQKGRLAGLDGLVRTCLAKSPGDRFTDVATLADALRAVLGAPTGLSQPPAALEGPAGAAPKRETTREKRRVALLFGATTAPLMALQSALTAAGGQLVQHAGASFTAAFLHDASDHPVRLAFHAAQHLRTRKLCEHVLVDLGEVSIQRRSDGAVRFFGAALNDKSPKPGEGEAPGIQFTREAADTLPEARFGFVPGRRDRLLLEQLEEDESATTFGLDRPSLVGRAEELAALMARAQGACTASVPTIVTLSGEPGFGKTHLARELVHRLSVADDPPEVVRINVREGAAGAQAQTYRQLLRRMAKLHEGMTPEDLRLALVRALPAEEVEHGVPAALFALGAIAADSPEIARLAAAPSALRLAAARVLGSLLRQSAAERALCIVIDDAHLADETTLDALEYATLAEAGARLFVCVCVRPSFAGARPAWSVRAAASEQRVLDVLGEDSSRDLARQLLFPVEYVPVQALNKLVERTQGVPRLMVELVRGLKRDGIVRRVERGTTYFLATDELDRLPDLPIVQWNARREVEALPAELQGHAKLCALLGGRFTLVELSALLDVLEREGDHFGSRLDAAVGTARLVRAGILVRHRDGEFAFRYALLRDTVYELLSVEERARFHRSALSVYRASAKDDDHSLQRRALHAARSGEHDVAAGAYLTLGQRALVAHAYLEAESAFGAAIGELADTADARAIAASRGRGLMRMRLGRHDDALRDLERARTLASAPGNEELALEIALDQATILDWSRQFAASEQHVREVERARPREGTPLYARLLAGLTRAAHRRGDAAASVELGLRAAALAQEFGESGYEARVIALLMVAPDCAQLGRLDEAKRHFAAVIAEAEAHGDGLHAAAAHLNRATLWYIAGDGAALVEDLERANTLARAVGEQMFEYSALNNLGETKYALEESKEALDYAERGLGLAQRLWGERSREVTVEELLIARIALQAGWLERASEASARLRGSIARAVETVGSSELGAGEELLARTVELALGGPEMAEAFAALAVRASAGDISPPEQIEFLEARAHWSRRAGLEAEAPDFAAQALAMARAHPNLLCARVLRAFA